MAGYYCSIGSVNARQIVCPVGYYCPTGTGEPEGCATVRISFEVMLFNIVVITDFVLPDKLTRLFTKQY